MSNNKKRKNFQDGEMGEVGGEKDCTCVYIVGWNDYKRIKNQWSLKKDGWNEGVLNSISNRKPNFYFQITCAFCLFAAFLQFTLFPNSLCVIICEYITMSNGKRNETDFCQWCQKIFYFPKHLTKSLSLPPSFLWKYGQSYHQGLLADVKPMKFPSILLTNWYDLAQLPLNGIAVGEEMEPQRKIQKSYLLPLIVHVSSELCIPNTCFCSPGFLCGLHPCPNRCEDCGMLQESLDSYKLENLCQECVEIREQTACADAESDYRNWRREGGEKF